MDLEDNRASIMAETEDRISNLPDDIIHRILSFLDMKYVVQTSILSRKWKLIWTSVPGLNLNSHRFRTLPMFAKFVKHVLARRNNLTEVSEVDLCFTGAVTQFFFRSILNYAYLHNIRQLTIMYFARKDLYFPKCLFSSHTLKHLTISNRMFHLYSPCCLPNTTWNFPALETLHLDNMKISDGTDTSLDLFSKCMNLKNLTLHMFSLLGVEVFNICAPQLSNLTITDPVVFPKVFNVVAPQLENLTASVCCENSPFFNKQQCRCCANEAVAHKAHRTLQLSTDSFKYLDKVTLSVPFRCTLEGVLIQLDLFQKLCSTKFLILNGYIIEALSCMDDLSHQPSPFDNLKCLKIGKQNDRVTTLPTKVRNYLLENSPNASVIIELPQVLGERRGHNRGRGRKLKGSSSTDSTAQSQPAVGRVYTQAEVDAMFAARQSQIKAQLRAQAEATRSQMAALKQALNAQGINIPALPPQ